ncbi:hypothetical protein EGR_07293 [Echinococcus granulosus]|uniref:Uncharacterized protein n=1 Tax=Echinococcus granulosus TaxID=6210 RepID=W6UI92_ECHGR|nr:hypothetical protein EGR_07293 [Echinococcus granulosus]EUB57822.1 hypothetical protein EGR_07293 [Echinococcus granulosus]
MDYGRILSPESPTRLSNSDTCFLTRIQIFIQTISERVQSTPYETRIQHVREIDWCKSLPYNEFSPCHFWPACKISILKYLIDLAMFQWEVVFKFVFESYFIRFKAKPSGFTKTSLPIAFTPEGFPFMFAISGSVIYKFWSKKTSFNTKNIMRERGFPPPIRIFLIISCISWGIYNHRGEEHFLINSLESCGNMSILGQMGSRSMPTIQKLGDCLQQNLMTAINYKHGYFKNFTEYEFASTTSKRTKKSALQNYF